MTFGPEYPKIQTIYKRDAKGALRVGDWTLPEFEWLQDLPWTWTEKIDGMNMRLHWDGDTVKIAGRSDRAQIPSELLANLAPQLDPELWRNVFGDGTDVTVYGEGYGAGIQSGGKYRNAQSMIVFDILLDGVWLLDADVGEIAGKLGLLAVPTTLYLPLRDIWATVTSGKLHSVFVGADCEGVVGRPPCDLLTRRGHRVIAKVKVRDGLHVCDESEQ